MESPAMRQRKQKSAPYHHHQYDDDDDDDELSFEPLEIRIKRDAAYRLSIERAHADNRFQATMAHIFEKYGRDFDGVGDEIDLMTGEILVDNGHLQNMRDEGDVGVANGYDDVPDVPMEDLVHSHDDDLLSALAPTQHRDQPTGAPPSGVPDDGLSSLAGLFGTDRPPIYGASPLGFGASPFAMEPWTMSDPFGLSPWDPPRLFPSPTDRYHFPSQDGGSSIWQPGYRFKDDEAVGQSTTTPAVLARVRPDVRTKPMKYMLPSSASKPHDADDQGEIDEDAILMGTTGAFSQLDAPSSTHMEIDELVMPLPQALMPPTDTQTDSTTTETDDAPPPKRPRLAPTSPEQPTQQQQQRLIVELQALHPSLRLEYKPIDEAATDDLADDKAPKLDSTKPAFSLNENDDTKPTPQGRSDAQGHKENAAPEGNVLQNDPTTTIPTLCLSDDEMPISLPKPKAMLPQPSPRQSSSPPPEAPPTSMEEDSTPTPTTTVPSSTTEQASSKNTSAEAKPQPQPQQLAPEQSASPPPTAMKEATPNNVPSSPTQLVSARTLRPKKSSTEVKPKPRRQQLAPEEQSTTSPPPEAPSTSTEDEAASIKAFPSSPAERVSTRTLRSRKASGEVSAPPVSERNPPPSPPPPTSHHKTRSIGRELRWLEKLNGSVSMLSRPSRRRRAVERTAEDAVAQESTMTETDQNPSTTPKEATASKDIPPDIPATPHEAAVSLLSKPKPQAKRTQTEATPKQQAKPSPTTSRPKPKPQTPNTAPPRSQRSILSLAADDDDLDDLGRDLFAPVTAAPRRTKIWKSTTGTKEVLRTPVKRRSTGVVSPGSTVKTPGGTIRTCGLEGYRCGRDFCFSCL
ncbi:hypothetical protein L249_0250 [Ophiocordyceps polyrhachis-furcata BCC 54312]|uniref:Uncharacterized protein n=1 Tax=Ophiocordyceps polyrhachis-furcata BCC 54312 TaxID=1330021 RepID=A0A367LDD0_9HYPO|nr:hypothetical protein L249_0250 [Ophiocordyceps polyrhachis-furcata BCC 54312]